MASERDVALFMAQVLDQTDRCQDMADLMKRVVALSPVLSVDERNLLAVSYKNLVSSRRNGLHVLSAIGQHDEGQASTERMDQIVAIREQISSELVTICNDLIALITDKILPAAADADATIFFEKLRADYYRYLCEALTGQPQSDALDAARRCYQAALAIARSDASIKRASPAYLGLVLNYTVFLNEAAHNHDEALSLAQAAYDECSIAFADLSEGRSEATMLLQILRDNITAWSRE
jgi:14-3-3 protein epsilon